MEAQIALGVSAVTDLPVARSTATRAGGNWEDSFFALLTPSSYSLIILSAFSFLLKIPMGFFSVLLAHIAFSIPIVVLMVLPRLYALNSDMMKAAEDLGANDITILNKIILPNIASGIFAGFFMALTYSLDDFAVTFFVTGSGFSTLSVEIYSRVRTGISLEINALSSLIFILSLILAIGYYVIQSREEKRRTR